MRIITQRDIIMGVVDSWKQQYSPFRDWGKEKKIVYQKLQALDLDTCAPEEVDNIIGNASWTHLSCDECDKVVPWVLSIGSNDDYESPNVRLCRKCIRAAFKLSVVPRVKAQ